MSGAGNDVNPPRTDIGRGGLLAVGIVLAIVAVLVTLALVARRHNAVQMEAMRAKWRQQAFDAAKAGNERPLIFGDAKAIEMLASDADCIRNVTHLQLSNVSFENVDLSAAHKLVNVRSISFYDCAHAEKLFSAMQGLPSVEGIGWESTYVSDDGIRSLAEFPNLKRVRVEDIVSDARERLLRESLPGVTLNIPNPERNEPN
jgi:hypothetical protein